MNLLISYIPKEIKLKLRNIHIIYLYYDKIIKQNACVSNCRHNDN